PLGRWWVVHGRIEEIWCSRKPGVAGGVERTASMRLASYDEVEKRLEASCQQCWSEKPPSSFPPQCFVKSRRGSRRSGRMLLQANYVAGLASVEIPPTT